MNLLESVLQKGYFPDDMPNEDKEKFNLCLAETISVMKYYRCSDEEVIKSIAIGKMVESYKKGELWCNCEDISEDELEPSVIGGVAFVICPKCHKKIL